MVSPSPNATVVVFSPGVWPCTVTPVRTSMLRLPSSRVTSLVMSSSQPGRIFGSASSTVTSVPRSAIIDANSHPMAPPPITTAVAGSDSIDSISSEVTTKRPSTSKPGMVRGTEPEASNTLSPCSSTSPDEPPDTLTMWSPWRVPTPS